MEHIGIDLGSKTSHICIIDSTTAKFTLETKVRTAELARWLSKRPKSRLVMETCTESFTIADLASDCGHEVRVVPASIVRELGVGRRKIKNDRRDAQVLARASLTLGEELPHVHVPGETSRRMRKLLALRGNLVGCRTKQVNAVKALLRQDLIVLSGGSTECFPTRVREELEDDPRLVMFEPMLVCLEQLTTSIRAYEAEIANLSKEDSRVKLLKTIPGVGLIVAGALVAAIDDIERFPDGAHLASYIGLTPGENTTGGKQRMTSITRAGRAQLRTLLIQACWTLVRVAPDSVPAQRYARLARGKAKQVAIVATARRLCVVIFAMLRDGSSFNPTAGAPKEPTEASCRADLLAAALRS